MNREDIIRMALEAGILEPIELLESNQWRQDTIRELERFASLVADAERKVIMDSLQKQADLATDALDRRWALEMIAAVAARSNT